jgi:multiple sugar transport system substrate-binding protein
MDPARKSARLRRPRWRVLACGLGLASAATMAAGCGDDSGPPTLTWYANPDGGSYTQASIASSCTKAANGKYTIETQVLPQDASQQRIQLARRLAAGDPEIDLMSLDAPFTAEFASAGFLAPLPEDFQATLMDQSLEGIKPAATWEGELVVAPFWANTQVLWYRKAFAEQAGLDMSEPVTWSQIIKAADSNGGTVGVQANKYEGYVVWINALIAGAGGELVGDPEKGVDAPVEVDSEAGQAAASVIRQLADSKAAEADLTVSNEGTVLGPFAADAGAFQVNWTFVRSFYNTDATKAVFEDLGWARYPQTVAGEESRPPLGGLSIGINDASDDVDLAIEAARCITSPEEQGKYAVGTGNMPASAEGYDYPALQEAYPADLLKLFQDSVDAAGPRTVSPYWSDISSALQSKWHPPSSVDADTPGESASFIDDVMHGRTLL